MSAPEGQNGAHLLDRIHVVLVEPQGPRNVGAVARAMRNFGLRQLRIAGGVSKDHPDAVGMAVHAADVLESTHQVQDLSQALAGMTFIVGSTAKGRERLPTLRPNEAATRILEEAARGQVALLFGREDHGLNAEEIARAHLVVAVETAPECRALNLSHAVMIVAYELFRAAGAQGVVSHSELGNLVTHDVRERLETELLRAMSDLGIVNAGNEIPCRRSIERILSLGPMQTRDARILFTLARRIQDLNLGENSPRAP